MRQMLVVIAILAGASKALCQDISPLGVFQSNERHSGNIAVLEPHLFLTVIGQRDDGSEYREVQSAPAIAVAWRATKAVQVSLLTNGLVSRPEEYRFPEGKRMVYAIIHELPQGIRGLGTMTSFEHPMPHDLEDVSDVSQCRVGAMEPRPYNRLAGKKAQFNEATPAELVFEITPPNRPGLCAYTVQLAGEWRTDNSLGTPFPGLAARTVSKSTKYSPFTFVIDWAEGDLVTKKLVDRQTREKAIMPPMKPRQLSVQAEVVVTRDSKPITYDGEVTFSLFHNRPPDNYVPMGFGFKPEDAFECHSITIRDGVGVLDKSIALPTGHLFVRAWSRLVRKSDGKFGPYGPYQDIELEDKPGTAHVNFHFEWEIRSTQ